MNTEIIKEKQSKKTESNILEKPQSIINYSEHEINNFKNGKVKIAKNKKDVYRFIERSQKYPSNAKLYFGKIGINAANRIKETLGVDVTNYNISLQTNAVRHIIKNHGNKFIESISGQIAVTSDDFKLIPQIVLNFDKAIKSGITENNNQALTFQKRIGNIYYLVSYISSKNHNLEVKTMWKIKVQKKELCHYFRCLNASKLNVRNGQRYEFFLQK